MSDASNYESANAAPTAGFGLAQGDIAGLGRAYSLSPDQLAAQRVAAERAVAAQQARYEAQDALERVANQNRLDRETRQAAVHAALMIEGERATADEVLTNAAKFAAFLSGTSA